MKAVTKIRLSACTIWLICGIISGGLAGYLSAVASAMFFTAILMELKK